jgi:hypothetical protein
MTTTTIYVLLGQSNTGDDDRLESIGVSAYWSLEAAKAAAHKGAEEAGEFGEDTEYFAIEWTDYNGGAWAKKPSADLEIRRIVVEGDKDK